MNPLFLMRNNGRLSIITAVYPFQAVFQALRANVNIPCLVFFFAIFTIHDSESRYRVK